MRFGAICSRTISGAYAGDYSDHDTMQTLSVRLTRRLTKKWNAVLEGKDNYTYSGNLSLAGPRMLTSLSSHLK